MYSVHVQSIYRRLLIGVCSKGDDCMYSRGASFDHTRSTTGSLVLLRVQNTRSMQSNMYSEYYAKYFTIAFISSMLVLLEAHFGKAFKASTGSCLVGVM